MIASTSPRRTIWPSVKRTCCSSPVTREITETVASGVTVPSAVTVIGTSPKRRLRGPDGDVGRPPRPNGLAGWLPAAHFDSRKPTPTATADHDNDSKQGAPGAATSGARGRASGGLDGLAHPFSENGGSSPRRAGGAPDANSQLHFEVPIEPQNDSALRPRNKLGIEMK